MLKNFKTVISLTLGVAAIAFITYACRKSGNTEIDKKDREKILFEDKANRRVFTETELFLGANVKKVTSISYDNSLLNELKRSAEWETTIAGEALDLDNIKRTYVHNSDVSLITVPVKAKGNEHNYFNVYLQGDKILITRLSEITNANGFTSYKVRSTNGELYYQFDLNNRNQAGNWKFEKDIPKMFAVASQPTVTEKDERCSKKKFYSCMNCLIIDVCGSDWLCTIMCGVAVPSCVGGAALVCLVA